MAKYKYTVSMLNIYEEIRILLLRKGLSMRKLAKALNDNGYKVPKAGGLSNKFNQGSIRFEEVQHILDYLGYEIVIREKK